MTSPENPEVVPTPSVTQLFRGDGGITFAYDNTDEDEQELEFREEPCGLLAAHGFGFLNVEFGECIGPDNHYEILRKLGFGMSSSVWLAKDRKQNNFVSIKILTGYATILEKEQLACELEVLRHISSTEKDAAETHCLSLLTHFMQPEKEPGEDEHLCLVTKPLGPTIDDLVRTNRPAISGVKKALRDVLKGLAYLHGLGVVHTDIHLNNVLVDPDNGTSSFDVESHLEKTPPQRYPSERTFGCNGFVRVAVSQPFPAADFSDWKSHSFVISDFGNAQFINDPIMDNVGPIQVRAPETILGLPWDEKVDIWAFGCLVYQCLTGSPLFIALTHDPELFVLRQIFSFTGERLSAETIRASKRGDELLFPASGIPKGICMPNARKFADVAEELRLQWDESIVVGTSALLKKCLRMDPKDRLSAMEILQDPWLNADA